MRTAWKLVREAGGQKDVLHSAGGVRISRQNRPLPAEGPTDSGLRDVRVVIRHVKNSERETHDYVDPESHQQEVW